MVDSLTLRFPTYSADVDKPLRNLSMPISFKTSVDYKHALEQILREHINIILLEMSRRYHECLATVNISNIFPGHNLSLKAYTGIDSLSSNTKLSPTLGNPRCQHGAFSKLVEVKKEGANKGRMFYTCANARETQCKFFEWAKAGESASTSSSASDSTQQEICSLQALETYLKSKSILFYSSCQLNRTTEHYSKKWVARNDTALSQSLYLNLNRKEKASTYTKGDLWVISQTVNFDLTGNTFLAKSIFYGPNSNNDVEISPIAGYYSCNWVGGAKCYALHAANVSTELECLTNLADLNARTVPLLPWLIHSSGPERTNSRFEVPSIKTAQSKMLLPEDVIDELAARVIQKYNLNEGQTKALMLVAETFMSPHAKPICLIKGVFGAGKSYLLAVTVQFIASVLNLLDGKTEGVAENYTQSKILIASMTNVAVDRILLALTEQGFTDFVRVGSLKKIAKPILPHSLHASGNVNTGLKELEGMLKDEEISQSEKIYVKKCISQQKIGLQKQKLGETRVVGVTCAACSFSVLDNLTFKVVLLDECSQMMEPLTLLPIKRAACTRLVLVGDPRQLKPTIQLSESVHQRGLEQTMFDRLEAMGMPTCQLTKQYRCHPEISSICRNLFYDGILEDGVTASQRPPLCNGLPAVCVFNIKGSQVYSHNSVCNEKEAKFVAQLVSWLLVKGGVDPVQIGIVTLYKAQVQVIVSYLAQDPRSKGVSVATVDSFQGGERDIIVLSAVRTDQMGFVDDIRRTNVALSRGKNHLFIVGHVTNLRRNPLWKNVVLNIEGFGDRIIEGESQIKKWSKQQIEAENLSFYESSHETSLNTVNGVTPSSKLNGVDADLNSPSLSFSSLTEEITDSPFPF